MSRGSLLSIDSTPAKYAVHQRIMDVLREHRLNYIRLAVYGGVQVLDKDALADVDSRIANAEARLKWVKEIEAICTKGLKDLGYAPVTY